MVASSIDVSKQETVHLQQDVNSGTYLAQHNGQIFSDGRSFSGFERNVTWISTPTGYTDISHVSGANSPHDSRSVIAADFDDDGDVDLFVHSIQRERHALYRNDAVTPGSQNAGFLKLRLTATTGNSEAIGATVIVTSPAGPVAQVLSRGAGFQSCQAPELIFGLGSAKSANVEVLWPGGARESFGSLDTGSRARLTEGTGEATAFEARPMKFTDPLPPGLRLAVGEPVPMLRLQNSQGDVELVDLKALADGKPVILNLWATYCAPCVRELPDLEAIHGQGEHLVVALCVDGDTSGDRAGKLLKRAGVSFPSYSAAPEADVQGAGAASSKGPKAWGLGDLADLERLTLPTTLFITRGLPIQ